MLKATLIPTSQRAVVQDVAGQPTISENVPVPDLRPGTMLVKTKAVALNPVDFKMGVAFPVPGAIVGMDYVGRVIQIAEEGRERARACVGDMVCGTVHGSNPAEPGNGAFTSYLRAPNDMIFRVPHELSLESAATLGVPLLTSGMAMWGSLKLAGWPTCPVEIPSPVLVYGGSTACGTVAIQLLKLSGYQPIVTCSPRSFDLVESRGASDVFDCAMPSLASEIKSRTGGRLRYAIDCITDPVSAKCCYEAMGRTGGRYASLEHCRDEWKTRRTVQGEFVQSLEGFGEEVKLHGPYWRPASEEKHQIALKLYEIFQILLDEGKLVAHPVAVAGHTLESVVDGMKQLKSGCVSGKRLVIKFEDEV